MGISTIILTFNEEQNIGPCLDSLAWCDDVHVFDSFSTDRTVEVARSRRAQVHQRHFTNYAEQRNAALDICPLRHEWVLMLDADERVEPGFGTEMLTAVRDSDGIDAWRLRRKDFFMGRWLRHASLYPSWFVRLFRHAVVRYDSRAVHEYPVVRGGVDALHGHLLHDSFSKGQAAWWQKHLIYAELEAREMRTEGQDWLRLVRGVVAREPVVRRRALKAMSYRLPLRPELRFLYMYLLRRGLLDGAPGWHYCRLIRRYQAEIDRHYRRLRTS
jgi:glycosyltransferase involved in cell wall biosynthesis